jgi:hypothetical protein
LRRLPGRHPFPIVARILASCALVGLIERIIKLRFGEV